MSSIKIGNKAPTFTLESSAGSARSLKDFRGKNVVLYFYPKDNTSGCTTQACDFRDNKLKFSRANTVIVGISPDSITSHDSFIEKFDLPFELLADEEKKVCKKYGVWKEKSMYGRKYMGVERSTFVIDAEGVLRAEMRKVKVPGHIDEVLSLAKEISKE